MFHYLKTSLAILLMIVITKSESKPIVARYSVAKGLGNLQESLEFENYLVRLRILMAMGTLQNFEKVNTETRKSKNLPYSILLNKFLTADRSCTTKYF